MEVTEQPNHSSFASMLETHVLAAEIVHSRPSDKEKDATTLPPIRTSEEVVAKKKETAQNGEVNRRISNDSSGYDSLPSPGFQESAKSSQLQSIEAKIRHWNTFLRNCAHQNAAINRGIEGIRHHHPAFEKLSIETVRVWREKQGVIQREIEIGIRWMTFYQRLREEHLRSQKDLSNDREKR